MLVEPTTDNGVIQSENHPLWTADSLIVKTLPKTPVGFIVYVTFLLLDEPEELTNE